MKILHLNFLFTLLISLGGIIGLNAQMINCNNNVNVSLGGDGTANLIPEMLLNGPHNSFDSLWLDIDQLDCSNIGLNTITAFGLHQNGQTLSCTSTVDLQDKLGPIAIGINGNIVILDANDQYTITPADVDGGSYDNCALNYTFSPSVIACGMANPVEVTMTVTDDSGNSASAKVDVYYEEAGIGSLACNDLVEISIPNGLVYTVIPAEVIEGGFPGSCNSAFWVDLEVDGQNRPDPTLTVGDSGSTIVYELQGGGLSCWGNISVTNVDCPYNFTEDMIEWPTDTLEIFYDICEYGETTLTPESLMNDGGFVEGDVLPVVNPSEPCLITSYNYSDIVFYDDFETKIIRTWTVLEWVNNIAFTYTQIIILINDLPTICDTLPWDAPVGDCASGHTLDDLVEWPADITIDVAAHLPSQLANNPNVNLNNAEPQLNSNTECGLVIVGYDDNFIEDPAGLNHEIERTWSVYALFGLIGSYTQNISIELASSTNFCAYRRTGDPIPGVVMAPGFVTDATGCVDMAAFTDDLVEPTKEGIPAEGVDINDKIIMYEDILGINRFDNFYQKYAGDLNQTNGVTTLDYVLVDRMITGLFTPDKVWTFFDLHDGGNKQFINVSENNPLNTFIGVKTGDVDDSYDLNNATGNPNETDLFVTDEVLNNGMVYRVPLYNPVDEKIQGFTINFENNQNLKIYNVVAPLLKGFTMADNVIVEDNKVAINYVAPQEDLENGGILVNKSAPLITVMVEATSNGILSEELTITDIEKNLLKSERFTQAARIKLDWEGKISNKVNDPTQLVEVTMSPNPTSGLIHLEYENELKATQYYIYNLQGRMMNTGKVDQGTIDASLLAAGMYALEIRFKDGSAAVKKFIKI